MKVVLVTGASSGIGACCAAYLSEHGYRVYGASRSAIAPPLVAPLTMDVTSDASVAQGVATILDREGRIDVLINNAGFGIGGAVEDTSMEEAAAQFDVNFFGVVRVTQAVLPTMRQRSDGYIVNIGSIAGLIAIPYQAFYSASKFALEGFTESLRLEVRPFGIRVVLIEPGDHSTGFTKNRRSTISTAYREQSEKAIARMESDEQRGPNPGAIARLVHKVLEKPNPRLRYTAGPTAQRAAVWLKRYLPNAVIEAMMRRYYTR